MLTALGSVGPAHAQDPGEIAELEQRRDELTATVASIDADLAQLDLELGDLDDQLAQDWAAIELLADELERTVHARREPAATRVELAIIGFTEGDPRDNALIDEVLALQGSYEPSRRRELYSAVIDDAQDRLAVVDARLVQLANELSQARDARTSTESTMAAATNARADLGERRVEATLALEETVSRIELLRSLENKAVLTGLTVFEDPSRPALAIKIDNVAAARPQAGINQADIVYVEEVESGFTRLAAIFHSTDVSEVGPVRSMRTGDFDLLAQFNSPLFSNSGGNRFTTRALRDSSLVDIGANRNGSLYYRSSGRRAPHNLFTNPANLWSVGSGEEYETGSPFPIFSFREPGEPIGGEEVDASGITIDYGRSLVTYEWNGQSYDRTQDGEPVVDTAGVRASPTTVVVHFTVYTQSPADPLSPEAITLGQGTAWILSEGKFVEAIWRRDAVEDQTEYVDGAGNPVRILPGRTWIEMPRTGDATRN